MQLLWKTVWWFTKLNVLLTYVPAKVRRGKLDTHIQICKERGQCEDIQGEDGHVVIMAE